MQSRRMGLIGVREPEQGIAIIVNPTRPARRAAAAALRLLPRARSLGRRATRGD
jgi:hypothetical protein